MEKLKVMMVDAKQKCKGYGDDAAKKCKEKVHVVAVPYPAQGHIVPLMQLCKKLASEEGVMVTFVNTMHNHARMLQAELSAETREAQYENNFNKKITSNIKYDNTTHDYNTCTNTTSTHINFNNFKINNNIRLVGIPGGLPPELHGDPAHVVAAFQASEALCGPLEKLLEKLNQEGPPVSCIISDVLVSWTQECAEKVGVPRFAFWTSSAAVYHVIWHMYGLISQGLPTFKAANTIFEDNNTEMVSCIPGLPPMDLNDLPIIVRSDPADFIYQFLTRQLKPMERAAAVLLNTFYALEEHCLQALPATSPVPIYSVGPLLPSHVLLLQAANFDGKSNGVHANGESPALSNAYIIEKYTHAANIKVPKAAIDDGKADGSDSGDVKSDGGYAENDTRKAVKAAGKAVTAVGKAVTAAKKGLSADGKAMGGTGKAGGKALCAEKASRNAAAFRSSAGIFREDVSCLEWLDKKEPRSVLYISFGSIFAMSVEQFTELAEGLQASKQTFLWAIRPGFVQGSANYTHSLPPSFLEDTQDRGMLVSWVPQLTVLAHPAIAGFLTHCGWNSTLESVALGVPMLCWPDVGERRTNGRLAVSLWQAGLEFSCSLHVNGLLISREEVKRVIHLLMDPSSPTASHLRSKAASLQMSARLALSPPGSSSHDWNLFLHHIQHPHCY